MTSQQPVPADIDEYIAGFPEDVRSALEQVRSAIREAAPEARETISYRMPTFTLDGTYLIYFAGYRKHVGLYPVPMDAPEFEQEVARYGAGKGTMRFPLSQPMPLDLIRRIVKLRADEVRKKASGKSATTSSKSA